MALPFTDPTQPAPSTGFVDPTQPSPTSPYADPTQPTAPANQPMQSRSAVTSSYDPNTGSANSFERGLHSGVGDIGVGLQRLKGLAQAAFGDRDSALKTLQGAQADEDQLTREGPQVSSYKDVHSLGDAGSYAAGLLGEAVPTLATMLVPGGAGGKIATKLAEKGATSLAAGFAEKVAAQEGAGALEKASAKIAGDAAKAVADRAHIAGEFTGSTLGGLPSTAGTTDLTPDQLADHPAKAALGTLAASAAGAVPAARLLERAGAGVEAGTEVAKQSGKFIPGVVKEAAAQGVTASVAGAAQTAATLATHKWIDNNSDMMSPAAFDQYLNSIIGGGVIGGLTGGLLGAAKGVKAPDLSGVKNPFTKPGAEVEAPKEGSPPQGDASASAPTPEAPPDPVVAAAQQHQDAITSIDNPAAKEAFKSSLAVNLDDPVGAVHKAYDGAMGLVRGDTEAEGSLRSMMSKFFSSKATETIDLHDEPAERFDEHLGDIQNDERVNQVTTDAEKAHSDFMQGAEPIGGAAPRSANPVKFDSPVENTIASFIPSDHPLWGVPDETKGVVKSVSKLFTGDDITEKDSKNIDLMGQIVGPDTLDKWKVAGPKYAELTKLADKVGDAKGTTVPSGDAAGGQITRPFADMPHDDLRTALAQADVGSPEHTVLQHEYSSRLAETSAVVNEDRSTGKSRAFFDRKAAGPDTVEVSSPIANSRWKNQQPGARQLVDLGTLVAKRLAGEGKSTGETPHQALASVLGDLKMGGVEIKPESVKPGTFYKSQEGGEGKLSPRQAAEIRGELAKVEMSPQAKAAGKEKAVREAIRKAKPKEEAPVDKDTALDQKANAREKGESSFDQRASKGEYVTGRSDEPREPGKTPATDKGGGIAEVVAHDPHEKTIADAREKFKDAKTVAEKGAIKHEAGVKIGTAEIKREGLNPRAEAIRLQRLNDPNTGLSRQFFRTATETDKFVQTHVRETKSDDGTPLENSRQKADANEAVREAYRQTLDKPSRFTRNSDVEAAIRRAGERDPQTRTIDEDKLLKTAREASDVLGEDHPFSRAVADTTPDSTVREHVAERGHADIDMADVHDEKPGKHQYGKETKMANAILKRMGFKGPDVTIRPAPKGQRGGHWAPDTSVITIPDHLHGPERIEVLAHELGHHLMHHELGEQLQKASPELRKALNDDYAAWAKKQFASGKTYGEIRASRAGYFRGEAVMADPANAKTLGEVPPEQVEYLFKQHEWFADNIARALTQHAESQSIIGKFFSGIAAKLTKLYDTMFKAGNKDYAPAPSVDKWVKSLFERNTNDVRDALGEGVPRGTAETYTKAAVHASRPDPVLGKGESVIDSPHFKAWSDLIDKLSPEQRGMLERLAYRRPVIAQIREYFKDDAKMLKAMEEPESEIAALSYATNKMLGEGKLDVKAAWYEPILKLRETLLRVAGLAGSNDLARRVLADLQSGEVAKTLEAGNKYDVRDRVGKEKGEAQQTLNMATALMRTAVYEPYRRFLYGPSSNAHLSYTPALRWVQSQMKSATGQVAERHGYTQDVMRMRTQFHRQTAQAMAGLDKDQLKEALTALQTNTLPDNATVRQGVQNLRRVFAQSFDYAKEAGVPLEKRANYFPVVPDAADISTREGDFRKFLSDPKWEKGMREALGDQKSTQAEMVDKFFKYASGQERAPSDQPLDPAKPPSFDASNARLWSFIYKDGTPEDLKTAASFQAKSFDDIAPQYFEGLTKRAEYARRFGDDGSKLEKALEKAKKQNASDADIQYARDTVAAHTGAYGADGSPLIRTILGDRAAKIFADPKTKAGMSAVMAYQNIVKLPLSLLSALADPMGIGVRYGGIKSMKDLNQAFKSLKDGFAAMRGNKEDLVRQFEIINGADDFMTQEILSDGMSPGLEGLSRKVSDKMFKWNGLSWYVRATRFMALSAANSFLLKHAAGLDAKNSARYLNELGVKASDIEIGKNGTVKTDSGDVERDTRVKNALARFVDEAILRTDASQHPRWMNDPAARLVAQYKQFGYAFADQIIDRIIHEYNYGNLATLGPALGYVPITVAAEMTRGLIQYGPGGNPNRDDWGWDQYATMGLYRSGLLGPQLEFASGIGVVPKAYAGMQHINDFGPTANQLGDVIKTLEGHRGIGSTVLESLPASSLYRHW